MSKTKQKLRLAKQAKKRRSKRASIQNGNSVANDSDHHRSQDLIATALQLQQSGELDQAKSIYLQILQTEPANPDAWHLLGMTLYSATEYDSAIECLQNADSLVPNHAEVLANLGLAHRGARDLDRACEFLHRSVQLSPNDVNAVCNLGTVYLELGKLESAEVYFKTALSLDPAFETAEMNLANVWQQLGKSRDAELLYRESLKRNPNNVLLTSNLGEALRNQAKWDEAADVLKTAVDSNPQSVETRMNLGRTLINLRKLNEAEQHFATLIEQQPNFAKPYHYLGKSKLDQRDFENAKSLISKSLELDPADVFARSSLGFAYIETGELDEAEQCFREVIERDPKMSDAHGSLLFLMSGKAKTTQEALFAETMKWAAVHGELKSKFEHKNSRNKNRKLRIGYVSPDLRNHAVAAFFRPVLQSHDREQFEVFCYAELTVADDTTSQLQNLSDHWRFTKGLSNEQVADKVFADQIDILVDLAGHTAGNRLIAFAHRPSPVQVTWLGYPNTTGLTSIDYRLTCETQNPLGEPTFHTEELIRMQTGSFCYNRPNHAPDVAELPAIKNGYVTFGSLHRPLKISETVRDNWSEVLKSCPDSRMLIFNTRFNAESTEELYAALQKRGVDRAQVDIQNQLTGSSYLEKYNEIDIGLDVTPWAGGTTTLESLWMGVPVIAFYGDRRSARSTAAIMKNVGHDQLIAYSQDQFIELAKRLAIDLSGLAAIRQRLRQKTEMTIVNSKRFTKELESTYRTLWSRWCES